MAEQATVEEWRYFSEALAWYEPRHGLTGAQVFGVVQQIRAALKDGRITPTDLGMVETRKLLGGETIVRYKLPDRDIVSGHSGANPDPRSGRLGAESP